MSLVIVSVEASEVKTGPAVILYGGKVIAPKVGQLIVQVHPNGCVASAWASGFLPTRRLTTIVDEHISGKEPRTQITTDLMRAVAQNNIIDVDRQLANNAKVNETNTFGCTATLWAVSFAYEDILALLLTSGADVNQTDAIGRSPLMVAAQRGALSIVKNLVSAGADLFHVQLGGEHEQGNTALHYAAERAQNSAVIGYLLEQGLDIDAVNEAGQSALMHAARRGNLENIQILLKAGANPHLNDKNGDTALGFAKWKKHSAVEKVLGRYQ